MSKEEGGLAFRNLHQHNISLVAKQAWRLLSRPQSLVARVYGARFFPTGRVMEAKHGSNSNYIWRSIRGTLHLIRAGARWRIGLGKQVRILKEP